ncbi:hypothetical protein ACQKM9_17460 [Viridibacillus sp. NPDC093762]|uniref:hypothetical protein n=1 Tax=Viridibacillus sp. NPDC093762 TaxID=3390720 RepID=UPI003CFE75B3
MKKKISVLFILFSAFLFVQPYFGKTLAAKYYSQNVTAYVAPSGNKTYHGTTPVLYNTAAVHPNVCKFTSSGTRLPKGTTIRTAVLLMFPDNVARDTFSVFDMGDVNCNKGWTLDFFDIYFGTDTAANTQKADDFGTRLLDYTTY